MDPITALTPLWKWLTPFAALTIALVVLAVWTKMKVEAIMLKHEEIKGQLAGFEKTIKDNLEWTRHEFALYTRTKEISIQFASVKEILDTKLGAMLTEVRAIKRSVKNGS